jgi:hypothetical protein
MSEPGPGPLPPVGGEPMYEWLVVASSDEGHTQFMRVPGGYIYAITRHAAGTTPPLGAAIYIPFTDVEQDPWVALADEPTPT